MTTKINDIDNLFNRIQLNIAEYLDRELYLPVKAEIGDEIPHSLGIKKEMFKNYIEEQMELLKSEIRKNLSPLGSVEQ